MISVCMTYFRSLTPANLAAALYSLSRQDLSCVKSIVIVDNNSLDSEDTLQSIVQACEVPLTVPVQLLSYKHGDPRRTHSWSSNCAVRATQQPWVFFTRADYILDPQMIRKCLEVVRSRPDDWNGFVTGNVYHLNSNIEACEQTSWRDDARTLRSLPGVEETYTDMDSGVWMTRRSLFEIVGGLDERLVAWGHAQTHFQYRLHRAGVEFVRVPEVLFYHPQHAADRDIHVAHDELRSHGIDIKELWQRYDGTLPEGYR